MREKQAEGHRERIRGNLRLFLRITANDLRLRYAGSAGGILWAFAMPAVTLLIFRFVFEQGFKNGPVGSVPYLLWFAAAYIPWTFLSDAVSQGSGCLTQYGSLVKKISFPVTLLPIVKVSASFAVHAFFVLILLGMAFAGGMKAEIAWLQLLYYGAAGFVLAAACCFLTGAITVFFRDNLALTGILLQIGFWVTPVVWDMESISDRTARLLLEKNPVYYITEGYRDSLFGGMPFWEKGRQNLYFWAFCTALWLVAGLVFARLKPYFADEL